MLYLERLLANGNMFVNGSRNTFFREPVGDMWQEDSECVGSVLQQ